MQEVAIGEGLGESLEDGKNGGEGEEPPISFAEAREMYLARIRALLGDQLDEAHLRMADAVLHMGYTLEDTLVQEVLEPGASERSLGYVAIDPEIEEGIVEVLMHAVEALDRRNRPGS